VNAPFGQPQPGFAESIGIEFAGRSPNQQLHDRQICERGHQHGAGRLGIVDLRGRRHPWRRSAPAQSRWYALAATADHSSSIMSSSSSGSRSINPEQLGVVVDAGPDLLGALP